MDRSDRLRRDQAEQARRREADEFERRHKRRQLESSARIGRLTAGIDAHGGHPDKKPERALRLMLDLWPATIAAASGCTAWTAATRAGCVERLEAVAATRAACETLQALSDEVHGTARTLREIARDLESAADRRRSAELAARLRPRGTAMRVWRGGRTPLSTVETVATDGFGLGPPGGAPVASDLESAQARLLTLRGCERTFEWLAALEGIDRVPLRSPLAGAHPAQDSPGDKASALAENLSSAAAELAAVGAAFASQAAACREYRDG